MTTSVRSYIYIYIYAVAQGR